MEGLFIEEIFIHCYEKDNLRGEEKREYKTMLERHLKHTISKNFNMTIDV